MSKTSQHVCENKWNGTHLRINVLLHPHIRVIIYHAHPPVLSPILPVLSLPSLLPPLLLLVPPIPLGALPLPPLLLRLIPPMAPAGVVMTAVLVLPAVAVAVPVPVTVSAPVAEVVGMFLVLPMRSLAVRITFPLGVTA
jgi:hypothetical protein